MCRPLTDDPGREALDSLPLFLPPLLCTGDAAALRLPDGGLLAERGWDEVGGREPGNNNNNIPTNQHVVCTISSLTNLQKKNDLQR